MGFLSLNGTLLVQLINFAIFFALLNVVFLRPVGKAVRARRDYINSVTSDYDRYQAEANDLRAQSEAIRAAARREAEQDLARQRAEASNTSAQIAADFSQRAAAMVEEAHRTVAAELTAARANQAQTAQELASLMVERTVTEAAG